MDVENHEITCPCKKKKCERHGKCDACKAHHHNHKTRLLTSCERLKSRKHEK